MAAQDLAAAMQRAQAVFQRRPDMGIHDDAPAAASWRGGTRMLASHANGTRVSTDMPGELGGSGDQVTPGWLFRAGLASCAATSIVMAAAAEQIELTALDVQACSRSDTRGLFGMADAGGEPVYAGPCDMQLRVRIAARAVSPDRLRALVEDGLRRSPIPNAVKTATPLALHIDTQA